MARSQTPQTEHQPDVATAAHPETRPASAASGHSERAAPVLARIGHEVAHRKNSNPFDFSDIDAFVADLQQLTRGEGDLFSQWHRGQRLLTRDEFAKVAHAYDSFGPTGQNYPARFEQLRPVIEGLTLIKATPEALAVDARYAKYRGVMYEIFLKRVEQRRREWDRVGHVQPEEWTCLHRALATYADLPFAADKLRHVVGDSGYALVKSTSYDDYSTRLKTAEPIIDRVLRKAWTYEPGR